MEVVSKELQYSETGHGALYCIKDGESFVFALSNYSWSLQADSEEQIDNMMQWDNSFQSFKSKMIDEMKNIIRYIGRYR
ncbi:MAG TPA: hypothetical protein VK105_18600 [Virgibacillus sp.]|nr:hypothetical protein [Virgibacillus sp.]HLR69098.1 hypothetical protein [Virgibacillus sp.]